MNDEIMDWVGGIVVLALIIWGGISVWNWLFNSDDSSYTSSSYDSGYNSSYSYDDSEDCAEPENPYDYGTGHYAGFEWGENGNYCSGNSDSFVEGCEEYESQEEGYEYCIDS